jgi:hypothetical protein
MAAPKGWDKLVEFVPPVPYSTAPLSSAAGGVFDSPLRLAKEQAEQADQTLERELARGAEEELVRAASSAGVQTPRCRLSSLKPGIVAPSREAYDSYLPWVFDGFFMGYNR